MSRKRQTPNQMIGKLREGPDHLSDERLSVVR